MHGQELLDEGHIFPCTRAISEAMRQNCTQCLRTDYNKFNLHFILMYIHAIPFYKSQRQRGLFSPLKEINSRL